tara:strand:- start:3574 stop:3906 length:333 start_codon:yes stop_codon:yes gene_type:complete
MPKRVIRKYTPPGVGVNKKKEPKKEVKKEPKKEPKKETINLGKEGSITFKKGTLRRQLHMSKDEKFTKKILSDLKKHEVGSLFSWKGKDKRMTSLLHKRISLGLTLMNFD